MGGKYNFENETLIDIREYDKNVDIHEMIHKVLSTKTTYGYLIDLLNRICKFDNSKIWLRDLLINNMNHMQEVIATNYEYLSYLKTDDFETYQNKINELKQNKKYYKYFNELSWTREYLNKENSELGESIAVSILTIGLLALDVNVWKIPEEAYESEKAFNRFLGTENNMNLFNPNTRFKTFINYHNPKKDTDEELIKSMMSDCQLDRDKIEIICIREILKIYKNYKNIDLILLRVIGYGTIDMTTLSFSFEEISYLNAFPTIIDDSFNNFKFNLDSCENKDFISKVLKVNRGIVRIDNTILGAPIINTLAVIDYEKKNAIYSVYKNGKDLAEIINSSKLDVAFFDIRTYPRFREILERNVSKDIYFIMESSVLYNIGFIRQEFINGEYSVNNYETYGLLVIKKGNKILLQLISNNAINLIDRLWKDFDIFLNKKEWNELYNCYEDKIYEIIKNYFEYFNFSLTCIK
ncbi:hypothetical protein U729_2594 [Clostridium baratii str. Sullivan]|uniref:Uncharacterized protein n=1 Tax=Clostridium baratii str. Sullivan TaxID=1415775 RepID=A0A0A7FTS4_9CLOT|nr:hypothetical protein [Clostridium baratii]AIY83044.1 hypothetical protein U729_2594 [Clostridium baratii str. Sullivan]